MRSSSGIVKTQCLCTQEKITAKTIINSSGEDSGGYGANAFFYDAAEGLLTSVILLVAEYCEPEKRHIISVFKMIQDLMAPSPIKNKSQFQLLMDKLPANHKAKWFAGAALDSADQAMASVLSTAMSRLNAFLDTEILLPIPDSSAKGGSLYNPIPEEPEDARKPPLRTD